MMVLPGGRERTLGEFEALLAAGGLSLAQVVPTTTAFTVIEAVVS
jgi:hypothetical protein